MFQSHSETSFAAYQSIANDEDGQLNDVLNAFLNRREHGGTGEEVHNLLKTLDEKWARKPIGTISARMSKLKDRGDIVFKGKTRMTRSGRKAEVWVHKLYATEQEIKITEEKPKPKKQQINQNIDNVERFLEALITSKVANGSWKDAVEHNLSLIKETKDLLK